MTDRTDRTRLLEELAPLPLEAQVERLRRAGEIERTLIGLVEEAARLVSVEADRAVEVTGRVMALADHVGAPLARARARRARARALSYAGRLDEALVACLDAVEIATQAGERVEAGRARLASMHPLGELGRLDEAIAVGNQARELFLAVGEPALAARADINLGISHQRQDQPAMALECFARARPELEGDALVVGHLDNSRGEAFKELNEFGAAEAAYLAALRAFDAAGAPLTSAIAEGNVADLAVRQGRLRRALQYFERARRHLEESGSPAHLARLLAEQADAKALLGLPVDALSEYEGALGELDRCGLALEAARARRGMGMTLLRLGRRSEATTALAAAAMAFDELGHASDRAKVDLLRADLALDNGGAEEARRLATQALASLHGRPADAAAARHVLARAALADGDPATAEAELAAATAAADRLDLAPLLADVLDTRGRLYRTRGRLEEAIGDLRRAVDHVERIRGSLQADRFRAAFLGGRSRTYAALLAALLDRADGAAVAEAFAVAERAKSRSLLDQVRGAVELDESAPAAGWGASESRLRRERARVQSELNALYSRLADDRPADASAGAFSRWRETVRAREQELGAIESRLGAARRGSWLFAEPLGLEEIQHRLAPGDLLLEYFVADGEVIVFAVSAESAVACRNLASGRDVEAVLARLQFQIDRALRPGATQGRRADRLLADARGELRDLDALLLAPLRRRIADAERLIVIPHGPLHLAPIHACFDGARHVVETHEVHTAPSASLFAHLAEAARPRGELRPLVVGVPDERAPQIAEEAERLARRLGCGPDQILLGAQATADRVIARAAEATLIHFACHGRFDRLSPYGSGLQLADRWLTVRDIAAMRLKADLVVLSGCETGLNLVSAGDELEGLLRSFFAAGAASLLVSLWPVEDRAAERFMTSFYDARACEEGKDRSNAMVLREAQLAMLEELVHPALWAPFILVGRS